MSVVCNTSSILINGRIVGSYDTGPVIDVTRTDSPAAYDIAASTILLRNDNPTNKYAIWVGNTALSWTAFQVTASGSVTVSGNETLYGSLYLGGGTTYTSWRRGSGATSITVGNNVGNQLHLTPGVYYNPADYAEADLGVPTLYIQNDGDPSTGSNDWLRLYVDSSGHAHVQPTRRLYLGQPGQGVTIGTSLALNSSLSFWTGQFFSVNASRDLFLSAEDLTGTTNQFHIIPRTYSGSANDYHETDLGVPTLYIQDGGDPSTGANKWMRMYVNGVYANLQLSSGLSRLFVSTESGGWGAIRAGIIESNNFVSCSYVKSIYGTSHGGTLYCPDDGGSPPDPPYTSSLAFTVDESNDLLTASVKYSDTTVHRDLHWSNMGITGSYASGPVIDITRTDTPVAAEPDKATLHLSGTSTAYRYALWVGDVGAAAYLTYSGTLHAAARLQTAGSLYAQGGPIVVGYNYNYVGLTRGSVAGLFVGSSVVKQIHLYDGTYTPTDYAETDLGVPTLYIQDNGDPSTGANNWMRFYIDGSGRAVWESSLGGILQFGTFFDTDKSVRIDNALYVLKKIVHKTDPLYSPQIQCGTSQPSSTLQSYTNSLTFWVDETANTLHFQVKYSDGTYHEGTVSLSATTPP